MKVKPDWINKVAVAGLILSLVGGGLWFWNHNHYILPSILESSIDPFADPPAEHNVLNRFVLKLRYARWTRIEKKEQEENRKNKDRELRDEFREFKFAGNRFWFSYYPADDSDGVDGEIFVSEGGKVFAVVLDPEFKGRDHQMQEDAKLLRGGEKTLFLETRNGRSEWEIVNFSEGLEASGLPPFELIPPLDANGFPITHLPICKEACFKDGIGNELVLEEMKDISEAKKKRE